MARHRSFRALPFPNIVRRAVPSKGRAVLLQPTLEVSAAHSVDWMAATLTGSVSDAAKRFAQWPDDLTEWLNDPGL